jgi:hypothetical protein
MKITANINIKNNPSNVDILIDIDEKMNFKTVADIIEKQTEYVLDCFIYRGFFYKLNIYENELIQKVKLCEKSKIYCIMGAKRQINSMEQNNINSMEQTTISEIMDVVGNYDLEMVIKCFIKNNKNVEITINNLLEQGYDSSNLKIEPPD